MNISETPIGNLTFEQFANQLAKTFDLKKLSGQKISRKKASELLGVSVPMIDKLIRSGKLKKYKIGSKTLLDSSQVEGLLS